MNIKTDKISLNIGNKVILKDIEIDVKNKQFIGIIGPNGSGKSTFLKCIYRNLKPSSGIITLNGIDINKFKIKDTAKKWQ